MELVFVALVNVERGTKVNFANATWIAVPGVHGVLLRTFAVDPSMGNVTAEDVNAPLIGQATRATVTIKTRIVKRLIAAVFATTEADAYAVNANAIKSLNGTLVIAKPKNAK